MPKEVISIVPAFSADYPRAPIYVADLVRCKNCKSYETKAFQYGYGYCKGHCSVVQDDDFCSYAELKSESENSNLTFEKADERCKGCNHYKLTCDLFSEICRFEPKDEPQTTSTPYKVDTSSICKIEPQTDCDYKGNGKWEQTDCAWK